MRHKMKKIENYKLPDTNLTEYQLLSLTCLITLSFGLTFKFENEFFMLIIMLWLPIAILLNEKISKPKEKEYIKQYELILNSMETKDIVENLENKDLNKKTIEFLINYLSNNRRGWSIQ